MNEKQKKNLRVQELLYEGNIEHVHWADNVFEIHFIDGKELSISTPDGSDLDVEIFVHE